MKGIEKEHKATVLIMDPISHLFTKRILKKKLIQSKLLSLLSRFFLMLIDIQHFKMNQGNSLKIGSCVVLIDCVK